MIEKALRFAIFGILSSFLPSAALFASDPIQVRAWIEQLRHPTVGVRIQAAAKLAEKGNLGAIADSSLEPLAKCLQDSNSNVRLYATFALGRIEADTERTVSLLVPLLADPDEHVRYSSEWSISEIAKTVSSQEMTAEKSRKLLGVFALAENQMSRGAFQERHILAVKMARKKLENYASKPVEIASNNGHRHALPLAVIAPTVPPNHQMVSISLYEANDVAGRLQLVDRMTDDSAFDDQLRLAILKLELQREQSYVGTYAIARWQSTGQRLLLQLFSELKRSESNTHYAIRVIQELTPYDSATTSTAVAFLKKLASDSSELNEIRMEAIEAISAYGVEAATCIPVLLGLIAQPQLSSDVRSAAVKAIPKLAPGSHDMARTLAVFMKRFPVEDSMFIAFSEALGDFGSAGAIGTELLVDGLVAEDVWTRIVCAESLEKIGELAGGSTSSLVARIVAANEEIPVKSQAASALKQIGGNSVALLMEQMQHPEAIVREHVLRALTVVANSNWILVEPCLSKLNDTLEVDEVRAAAATALGSVGLNAQPAVPALLRACGASQPTVLRAAAIIALARIEPKQASLVIQANLNDSEFLVRASAAFGLHLCGDTTASLDALLRLLDESESDQLIRSVVVDLGPAGAPSMLQTAAAQERSARERLCCVQAAIAMPNVDWPPLIRLLEDQEIGDQVASLVESSEHFESDVIPLLIGWLREERVGSGTRSRIVAMIEADGLGAGDDEVQWADTLAINQPGANRNTVPLLKESMETAWKQMAAMRSAMQSSAMRAAAMSSSGMSSSGMSTAAMQSEERSLEFSPESEDRRTFGPNLKHGDNHKVAVFYGTNRSPVPPRGLTNPIVASHVVLAGLALVAMIGCFFLFPRHSNIRYAIASLVGMSAVSTLALQMMLLTNWPGASRELLCYGGEYSDQIQYGVCEVSIPEGHQPGELESPQMFKMEVTQDPEKHIVLTNVERLPMDAFHAVMKTELDRKGNNIFVFIHGYNVSFEDAARRTGQMAYDLKFPGAPVFYSWPSQANWYSYVTDKGNIDLSTSQIRSFLLDIAIKSKADTINLIAHSMGNVGLTAALSEMEQISKPHFNQVVLAAPDIDASVFKNEIASKIVAKARHTTLYTSRTDLALIASRYFNQRNRVGDSGPEVLIIDGIDTIDATAVDSSLLGHTYYGSNVTVLDDLGQLLQNQPIESRHYLKSIVHGSRPYWAFEPMQISRVPSPPMGVNR